MHTINNGLTPIQEYRTQMFYTVALSEWGSEPPASTYWPTAGRPGPVSSRRPSITQQPPSNLGCLSVHSVDLVPRSAYPPLDVRSQHRPLARLAVEAKKVVRVLQAARAVQPLYPVALLLWPVTWCASSCLCRPPPAEGRWWRAVLHPHDGTKAVPCRPPLEGPAPPIIGYHIN